MPAVTVVIPAYNAAATISETLSSLLGQSFADFEAVVIDDGSSDATASVVRGIDDPRVRLLSIPNGGVARARNYGVAHSTGEFVAFLDSDDLWEQTKLAEQIEALAGDAGAGFCVTGAFRIDEHSNVFSIAPLQTPEDVCRTLLLEAMAVGYISSGLVRRSLLATVGGFNPEFSYCADWDLWLRLAAVTRFAIIEEPLMSYRTSPGNMSSNGQLLEHDTFAVLNAFFSTPSAERYRSVRNRAYSNHWMFCAGSYLHQGKPAQAIRCLAHGVALHPANLRRALGMPARQLTRATRRRTVDP